MPSSLHPTIVLHWTPRSRSVSISCVTGAAPVSPSVRRKRRIDEMSIIPFLLLPFLEYLVVSGIVLWVLLRFLKQKMSPMAAFAWLVPICVWLIMVLIKDSGSLANFVFEPLILGIAVPVSTAVWMSLATTSKFARAAIVAVVVSLAVCVRLFIPVLPE